MNFGGLKNFLSLGEWVLLCCLLTEFQRSNLRAFPCMLLLMLGKCCINPWNHFNVRFLKLSLLYRLQKATLAGICKAESALCVSGSCQNVRRGKIKWRRGKIKRCFFRLMGVVCFRCCIKKLQVAQCLAQFFRHVCFQILCLYCFPECCFAAVEVRGQNRAALSGSSDW